MAAAGVPVAPGTTDPAADVDGGGGRGGPDRLPGDGQGGRRRRRHGHGRGRRRGRAADRVREGPRLRRADVRRRLGADRALLPVGAPRRGADPRPGRRPGGRAGRARVLGAAAQPEAGRGVAVAGLDAHPGAAGRAAGRGGPGRRGGRLPQRRHGRVPARPGHRGLLLPGDEHPAAGRAPDHRGGLRHRPGRGAAAGRGRAAADVRPGRAGPARARDRAADQRRGPQAVPARPGRDHHLGRAAGEGVRVDSGYAAGHHGHARTTTR